MGMVFNLKEGGSKTHELGQNRVHPQNEGQAKASWKAEGRSKKKKTQRKEDLRRSKKTEEGRSKKKKKQRKEDLKRSKKTEEGRSKKKNRRLFAQYSLVRNKFMVVEGLPDGHGHYFQGTRWKCAIPMYPADTGTRSPILIMVCLSCDFYCGKCNVSMLLPIIGAQLKELDLLLVLGSEDNT